MFDLLFTGDTFLQTKLQDGVCEKPLSLIGDLLKSSSHVCVNLETTVGSGGTKVAKAYNFQTKPETLQFLIDNNVQICNLANNHSNDFGENGLSDTIKYLENRNVDIIGLENQNLIVIEFGGKKVAICSYYGKEKGLAELNLKKVIDDINQYKGIAENIIVCLHWGVEYVAYPSPRQQQMAHAIIDAGASVVIGHHPHVMQGFEEYKGRGIFYSLGNFNFFVDHPYAQQLIETTKAYCVGFFMDNSGKLKYEVIPVHINDIWQPCVISNDKEKERFFKYFAAISKPLTKKINNLFWYAEVAPHYFHNHLPSWKKRIKNYGIKQCIQMIKWLIHPSTYIYYLGMVISLFHKSVRY